MTEKKPLADKPKAAWLVLLANPPSRKDLNVNGGKAERVGVSGKIRALPAPVARN